MIDSLGHLAVVNKRFANLVDADAQNLNIAFSGKEARAKVISHEL